MSGGEGGIRTHGTVSRSQHFQCCQFNHSCTSPRGISDCELRISDLKNKPGNAQPKFEIRNPKSEIQWRRGWDLNPRWSFPHSGFRDRCTKPLCDLSLGQNGETRRKDHFTPPCLSRLFYPSALTLESSRRARKNCCISLRQSSSRTPAVTAIL